MRVIIEVFGKAWDFSLKEVTLGSPGDESGQKFDEAPVDPHSVSGCQVEHASQSALEVQELSGAGVYAVPADVKRFGFRGSKG